MQLRDNGGDDDASDGKREEQQASYTGTQSVAREENRLMQTLSSLKLLSIFLLALTNSSQKKGG